MSVNQKVVVITGGGRGIGLGITRKFLQSGAYVVVAQRNTLPDDIRNHPNTSFIQADLSLRDAPYRIANFVKDLHGYVDILINNAGIMFEKSIDDMNEDDWDNMMIINMRAPVFLTKALLPLIRQRNGGSIINIGSIEGIGSNPWHTAYCSSKAGIHGMTRAMAVDLGKDNIRCNAIAPGWINSDLSNDYLNAQTNPTQARQDLIKLHPSGRTGEPEDIGAIAVFLASDEAQFITGQVIVVDGGRTSKLPLPF